MNDDTEAGSQIDYRNLPHEETLKVLESNPSTGLTEKEAEDRLSKHGYNEVPEKKPSPLIRLGRKFWGLTAWMLELTMIFSLFLQNFFDFYVIAALLIVNAIIGYAQEQKASRAVEALRNRLHVNAKVLRDGKWQPLPARMLVPGDIVRVRAGDFVPADLKIIQDTEINVDQSALTGESLAAEKRENDLLFSGSIVQRGETSAVVVTTGPTTYFGRTTELLQTARPKLHMEEITSGIVRYLLIIVGVLIALVLAASYAEGIDLLQVIPLALVLIVFAVPVALPAMFTVSMAIGSQELARKGVLVTRLSASEDAASMDTLCADKTGTITMNRLAVTIVIAADGIDEDNVILYGALASQEANQDPIDIAFIRAAKERNLPIEHYVQRKFSPFDPKTRKTEAVISDNGTDFKVMKGAVEVVAQASGLDLEADKLSEKMNDFATRGFRTLAVARSDSDDSVKFCGLVALEDTPRPDSKDLMHELSSLGVSVKMLTGDALPIAREISKQVGLGGSIVRASELRTAMTKSQSQAVEIAERSDGFAEVYPEDKYTIVRSLQASDHVVGMTGDGVNDAPALQQAEVGIAVSNATDVAKGAASVVLTAEGLSNIVDLVKTGRMIYQRIVTWVLNKIVKTFEVAVFVALAFLLTGRYVVSALDIVLLLFAVDFVTISLSTDRVRWSRQPDKWNVTSLVKVGVSLGVVTLIELFVLLYIGLSYLGLTVDANSLHTFTFAALFYFGMLTVLIVRERGRFWRSAPSRTLSTVVILDMVLVALLVVVGIPGLKPLPVSDLMLVFSYALILSFLVNDQVKHVLLRRFSVSV